MRSVPRTVRQATALGAALALACSVPALAAGDPTPAAEGAAHLARGNSSEAIASLTAALADTALSNDRRASILNDRAVAYMRVGQVKEALADFNEAAQLFPEFAAIYNNRGNLLLSLGLLKEAVKDFDRAIVLAPGYAAAYNNRAGTLARLGNPEDAISDYTRAIELLPASAAPLSGRGRVQLSLQRPHAAIRDFTRAVNADPRFASGYRNRAEAKLEVEHYDEAIEDLSRAIAFDVSNGEIYVVRGRAYLSMGNIPAAITDFTQAIELSPSSAEAYAARGLANGMADALDEAFADLNKAIDLDPRSAVAFAFRAYVYKLSGQIEIAEKDIETAGKLAQDQPEVYWAQGEIEEGKGDADRAIESLRKAVELRPGFREASQALLRLTGGVADDTDKVIAGAGVDDWRVVLRSGRYYAASDKYPTLFIPLEMLGEGMPKLLEWEVKPPPVKGIGILRFSGGIAKSRAGAEEIELVAVIDVDQSKVLAIIPHKRGTKTANWTWEEGRVVVASVDGVTEELNFKVAEDPALAARTDAPVRRYASPSGEPGGWAPWDTPWAGNTGAGPPRSQRSGSRKKPKTLFDLLFN